MADKVFNTRIQHKIDTAENWGKATNFVPKSGEIIIYSDSDKIKVGDGNTVVGDLPFISDYDSLSTTKADIASPALTGRPTAPTAPYGTNTTQIATCAFVQSAIKASILISTSPATANIVCTATQDNGLNVVSGTTNSLGQVYLTIPVYGTYNLTYNNPTIRSQSSITVNAAMQYAVSALVVNKVEYTIKIDENDNNPLTCITYEDNATCMAKGSSDWDSQPIFNGIRPCLFKNGTVQAYLNPDDSNYDVNGNEVDLTGENGDVMIEFSKFAYRIYREEDSDAGTSYLYVSITNDDSIVEEDSRYHYYAFSRLEEGDLDFFYHGAFKGWVDDDGALRSLPGKTPTANKNIGAFRTAAQLNGSHYQQSTYAQLVAIQCLYLIKYGNMNGQSALGRGIVSSSLTTTGGTLTSGMNYGTTSNSTTHVKLFGIEDMWGNIWEWVDGLTTSSTRQIITSWNSYSNEGLTATTDTVESGLTSNSQGYVKKFAGTTESGFMGILFSGSSSTYSCDDGYLYSSCVLYFGGRWNSGDYAGPFYLHADYGASAAYSFIGARLAYS